MYQSIEEPIFVTVTVASTPVCGFDVEADVQNFAWVAPFSIMLACG